MMRLWLCRDHAYLLQVGYSTPTFNEGVYSAGEAIYECMSPQPWMGDVQLEPGQCQEVVLTERVNFSQEENNGNR